MSGSQRADLEECKARTVFLGVRPAQFHGPHVQKRSRLVYCSAVAILKFLLFEQGACLFLCTNCVANPAWSSRNFFTSLFLWQTWASLSSSGFRLIGPARPTACLSVLILNSRRENLGGLIWESCLSGWGHRVPAWLVGPTRKDGVCRVECEFPEKSGGWCNLVRAQGGRKQKILLFHLK